VVANHNKIERIGKKRTANEFSGSNNIAISYKINVGGSERTSVTMLDLKNIYQLACNIGVSYPGYWYGKKDIGAGKFINITKQKFE
jgi:hypothetical protein